MIKTGTVGILSFLLLTGFTVAAETTNALPPFGEVYDLLQKNLTGLNGAELNRAAVEGLLRQLGAKASIEQASGSGTNRVGLSRSNVFDNTIAYLRLDSVRESTAAEVRAALAKMYKSNRISGVVLDLRYAEGQSYPAAAAAADVFIRRDIPLLEWEGITLKAKASPEDVTSPVAVLVNRSTSGAAEVLAALIREGGAGLLIGGQTAGNAAVTKAFPLSTGGQLRVAVAPIRLADGGTLGAQGLAPDITVTVSPEEERAYYADAFRVMPRLNLAGDAGLSYTNLPASTNRPPRRRYNEADLVRDRREGVSAEETTRNIDPEPPLVNDPALARAIDLLKGLAVVRAVKS